MFYPIIFEPILKSYLWGGDRITRLLDRGKPGRNIGESWDITCRPSEMGIAANGKYAGRKFIDIINLDRKKYLGEKLEDQREFPLLVKVIDANADLSVQVHPTDSYAEKYECEPRGKSEIWYVLEPPENGEIILGIKPGISRNELRDALESGDCMECFSKLAVKSGDIVNVPAGLVHALTAGAMVIEIQQNTNITYRLFDYNRLDPDGKPRELNIGKALDVIDFEGALKAERAEGTAQDHKTAVITQYVQCDYYDISRYDITDSHLECSDPERFYIFSCVDGNCEISTDKYRMDIRRGDSVFIPAALGEYRLTGECSLIKSFVP